MQIRLLPVKYKIIANIVNIGELGELNFVIMNDLFKL